MNIEFRTNSLICCTSVDLLTPVYRMYIEENIRTQRESELWRLLHRGRITSFLFGEVLHAKSLIQRILNGSNLDRSENFNILKLFIKF